MPNPIEKVCPIRVIRPEARLRLFCFHFVGADAEVFRVWGPRLAPHVEVCAVELPGRTRRSREPLVRNIDTLVDMLLEDLTPLFDTPYALFGHSLGAKLAFELARRTASTRPAEHLFLSASPPPHLPPYRRPIVELSDQDLVAEMRRLGGTPREVLEDPELVAYFLPIIRADYEVVDGHRAPDGTVDVPLTVLAGASDPVVPAASMPEWKRYAGKAFRVDTLPGGHFFLQTSREAVMRIIERELEIHSPPTC
jgi:medium-chain acyl-[acyl-carrier-protein] hydrolase